MLTQILKHKWFLMGLFLVILLGFFRFSKGTIQQDNYVGYAMLLPFEIRNVSFYDSRLLPGLSIIIYLLHFITGNFYVAGYLVTLTSFVGSYILLYKLTHSNLSFLPLVFPPIMMNLASLIDTEFPFIFLTIFAYFLFKKEKVKWAFLLIGLSVWFRLAGFAIIAGFFVFMFLKKETRKFFLNLPYFLVPVVTLSLYNIHYFGVQNPLYQLFTYEALHPDRISVGILQLAQDLVRAFRWGWYRILASGLFYILLYFYLYFKLFKTKNLEFWLITGMYLFTLLINLVPFLENLGRYLAPTLPLFWLTFYPKKGFPKMLYLMLPISCLVVLL